MGKAGIMKWLTVTIAVAVTLATPTAFAKEVNDKLAIGASLFGIYQYGDFSNNLNDAGKKIDSRGEGAVGLDLDIDYTPTPVDELYARLRLVADNGLNDKWFGGLAPFSSDLEDDVKDVNGHSRDYLLEAWYKHRFVFGNDNHAFSLTGGIIDSADFLDDNAYADDEMLHFMNDAFVTRAYMPAWDTGAGAELDLGKWGVNAVWMNSKTGDAADKSFDYLAGQVHYHANPAMGEGTYRLWAQSTSSDFLNSAEDQFEHRHGTGISINQAVGEKWGFFIRLAWQTRNAAVNYKSAYTGGVHLNGVMWGRADDEAGLAYGYLEGGNQDIDRTDVFEAYARFKLNRYTDITADIQYMNDDLQDAGSRKAWIPGLRLVASY